MHGAGEGRTRWLGWLFAESAQKTQISARGGASVVAKAREEHIDAFFRQIELQSSGSMKLTWLSPAARWHAAIDGMELTAQRSASAAA
jgi:hypothetical protein